MTYLTRCTLLILSLVAHLLFPFSATTQDRLVMVSPHWEGLRYETARAFSLEHQRKTGRTVEVATLDVGGTADIVRFVRSEFGRNPQTIGVDIFYGGGVEAFEDFKRSGFLAKLDFPPEVMAPIAPAISGVPLYDPEHHWFAPIMNAFGILCNLDVLKRLGLPLPRTFENFAQKHFFSWLGAGDPRKSGSAHIAFEIILQGYGWEKGWQLVHAIAGNLKSFSQYSALVPQDVVSGEIACGLSIDNYAWSQIKEFGKEHISFSMAENTPVINGDAIAAFKGAPHAELAKEFIEFTLSKPAQRMFMLPKGTPGGPERYTLSRLSVMPEMYRELAGKTDIFLNPFELRAEIRFDPIIAAKRYQLINDLFGSLVIDPLKRLRISWKAATEQGTQEQFLRTNGNMPFSEAQGLELATSADYRDPLKRQALIANWRSIAEQRYAGAQLTPRWLLALPSVLIVGLYLMRRIFSR